MAQPLYTYQVGDLRTGAVLGDLPLTGVSFNKKLNDSGTFSGAFTLESRNAPRRGVDDAYDWTMPARRTITAYRDDRLVWGGIIWTSNYDSDTRTVSIGAGDYWTYFDHRMILPVLALVPGGNDQAAPTSTYIAELTTRYTGVDQNAIARALVTQAQAHTGGNLDIQLDTTLSDIARDREYPGHQLATVGDALRKLAGVIDGPDIMFDVAPSVDVQGRPVRRMLLGTPQLGLSGSAWVWEYDANVVSYKWPRDGTGMVSRAFATGDGAAEGVPVAVSEDTDVYAAAGGSWPLLETEGQFSGVVTDTTLQEHADTMQALGRRPVTLPTLVVRGDMTPTVGEWSMGDDGLLVVEDDFFHRGMSVPVRIVTADISPGEDTELVTFACTPLIDDVY